MNAGQIFIIYYLMGVLFFALVKTPVLKWLKEDKENFESQRAYNALQINPNLYILVCLIAAPFWLPALFIRTDKCT